MAPGPAPKPEALNELAGYPGHAKPPGTNNPEPTQELYPQPPPELDEAAIKIWDAIVQDLTPLGLITRIDKSALGRWCIFYSQFNQVKQEIATARSYTMPIHDMRYVVNPATGNYTIDPVTRELVRERYVKKLVTIPQFSQLLQLSAELRKLESEFGLTPAARTRINIKLKEGDGGNKPRKEFTYRNRRK